MRRARAEKLFTALDLHAGHVVVREQLHFLREDVDDLIHPDSALRDENDVRASKLLKQWEPRGSSELELTWIALGYGLSLEDWTKGVIEYTYSLSPFTTTPKAADDEFVAMFDTMDSLAETRRDFAMRRKRAETIFEALDKDGSGEVRRALYALAVPGTSHRAVRRSLRPVH